MKSTQTDGIALAHRLALDMFHRLSTSGLAPAQAVGAAILASAAFAAGMTRRGVEIEVAAADCAAAFRDLFLVLARDRSEEDFQ